MWRIYFEPSDFTGYTHVNLDVENFQEINERFIAREFPYVTVTHLSDMDGMQYDGVGGLIPYAPPPATPTLEEQIAALTVRVEDLEAAAAS